jgi:hypothetical protein
VMSEPLIDVLTFSLCRWVRFHLLLSHNYWSHALELARLRDGHH